jgi:hypothetical protein
MLKRRNGVAANEKGDIITDDQKLKLQSFKSYQPKF